ncbi:DUF2992 family protein [Desulfovibrio sp.]|uniref:DUF2992 family protein n=1 Tax=Desulfovibrio sp. TaxID=885 RepID=UPI0039B77AFF
MPRTQQCGTAGVFLSSFEDSLLWTESPIKCSAKALAASPKRRSREAGAAVRQSSGAIKAREAVKLGRALRKIKNAKTRKSQRNSQSCIDFTRKQQKKKQKHQGH